MSYIVYSMAYCELSLRAQRGNLVIPSAAEESIRKVVIPAKAGIQKRDVKLSPVFCILSFYAFSQKKTNLVVFLLVYGYYMTRGVIQQRTQNFIESPACHAVPI